MADLSDRVREGDYLEVRNDRQMLMANPGPTASLSWPRTMGGMRRGGGH